MPFGSRSWETEHPSVELPRLTAQSGRAPCGRIDSTAATACEQDTSDSTKEAHMDRLQKLFAMALLAAYGSLMAYAVSLAWRGPSSSIGSFEFLFSSIGGLVNTIVAAQVGATVLARALKRSRTIADTPDPSMVVVFIAVWVFAGGAAAFAGFVGPHAADIPGLEAHAKTWTGVFVAVVAASFGIPALHYQRAAANDQREGNAGKAIE